MMQIRRAKLAERISFQAAAVANDTHAVTELRLFPLREPASKRTYTVVRLRTRSGLTGYAECVRVSASDAEKAKSALIGRPATSYAVTLTGTPLDGAIATAMVDITAKVAKAPAYRLLGGPTRTKVRALTTLATAPDQSAVKAVEAGFRALQVPVGTRIDALRTSGGHSIDFVLDGRGQLTPGNASRLAASLEGAHLLWFDEPCPLSNLQAIRKINEECVTPLGFGRTAADPSVFQNLLREGVVDILRPDLHHHGIPRIRQIGALAETYYTAVAPNHEGGPVSTAAAIQLAASLPNFFIQHIPFPAAEEDRRMRAELVNGGIETVRDGFLSLPNGPGLGIEVNEAALEKYKDVTA